MSFWIGTLRLKYLYEYDFLWKSKKHRDIALLSRSGSPFCFSPTHVWARGFDVLHVQATSFTLPISKQMHSTHGAQCVYKRLCSAN